MLPAHGVMQSQTADERATWELLHRSHLHDMRCQVLSKVHHCSGGTP